MDPEQLAAAVAVADESLAAQTPDYGLQAAIAQDRPDLWAALASNPTAYPDLLTWLSGVHEPTVRLALEARGIAPQTEAPQTGEDARGQSRSEEPVDPQADQAEAGSQAVGEVSDEGAESRADGGASEEAVEPGADEAAPQSDGAVPEEEVAEEPAESQADSDAPAEEADELQADEGVSAEAEPEAGEGVPQADEGASDGAGPEEPAGPQAVGEVSDEGAESRADGGASEEAVEPGADEAAPQSDGAVPEEEVAEEPAESQADGDAPAEEAVVDAPQVDEAAPVVGADAQAEEAVCAEAEPEAGEDVPQSDEGAPDEVGPEEPAGPQAVGEVSDEGAESRADGGASEEAVEPGADEAAPQSDGAVPEEEVAEEPAESQADSDAPAEEADEPQADEAEPQAEQTALADEAAPAEAPSPPVETPAPPPGSPLAAGFASRAVVASDNSFVPTPGQVVESYDPAPSSSTRSRKLVAVLAVLALLFVGGTGGWLLMDFIHRDAPVALSLPGTGHRAHQGELGAAGGPAASGSVSASGDPTKTGATNYVTPCGSAPTFTPTSVKNGEGELKVEVKVTASCPSGDVLGGSANHIELKGPSRSDGTGSADAVIASGDFDFSGSPLVIPDSGTTLTLRFGNGHFFRTADDMDVKSIAVACTPDRASGTSGATAGAPSAPGSSSPSSASASTTSKDSGSEESAAESSLRWQVNHDRPSVTRSLSGKWVAQLSSKKPGMTADGITWDNRTTLQEFLKLRQKYPDAKLLYSEDWPVFDAGGKYWVTIAGTPYSTAAEANAWCDAQGFDAEHCFAKYIDTKGPSDGTTVNR